CSNCWYAIKVNLLPNQVDRFLSQFGFVPPWHNEAIIRYIISANSSSALFPILKQTDLAAVQKKIPRHNPKSH
ncbi:MAG TPA: hypothetical protein VJ044_05555, partial [Candidatus Hodarchaeales archaeon]|nr:hypothetical protein [Candidatus Hodarchaeales archaeon]